MNESVKHFAIGDKVRRINCNNDKTMLIGSEWVVSKVSGQNLAVKGYREESLSCTAENFELIEKNNRIEVGDTVERIKCFYSGMNIGDQAVVTDVTLTNNGNTSIRLNRFKDRYEALNFKIIKKRNTHKYPFDEYPLRPEDCYQLLPPITDDEGLLL